MQVQIIIHRPAELEEPAGLCCMINYTILAKKLDKPVLTPEEIMEKLLGIKISGMHMPSAAGIRGKDGADRLFVEPACSFSCQTDANVG